MKVMQVITNLALGGAEIMCENLSYELKKMGNEVIVVSLHNKITPIVKRLQCAGIEVVLLDKKDGKDFSIIKKLRKIFKEKKPDVLHTHLVASNYAMIASMFLGIKKRIHTIHSIAKHENIKLGRFINKLFFKFFHVIPVALSKEIQKTIIYEYKLKEKSVPIIFNGINISKCKIKKDYKIIGTTKILHIGSFKPAKNQKLLIEVIAYLINNGYDIQLNLIGAGGSEETNIKEYVKEVKLDKHVVFHGSQENVYPFLCKNDIFVLTSTFEGMPITIIEAMATGLPIVSTAVGGVPDMLKNQEDGLLTSVNLQEIANAIQLLMKAEGKRKELGEHAKLSSAKFSAKEMTEKYIEIYNI